MEKVVRFWHDQWIGNDLMKKVFPTLFEIVVNKKSTVVSLRKFGNSIWQWNFHWDSMLDNTEVDLYASICCYLCFVVCLFGFVVCSL